MLLFCSGKAALWIKEMDANNSETTIFAEIFFRFESIQNT